jgi:apolipoprotein N-acyltransferase
LVHLDDLPVARSFRTDCISNRRNVRSTPKQLSVARRLAIAFLNPPGTTMRTALVAVSGVMLAAAFPKYDLDLLAWIAFVPLLCAVRGRPLGSVFAYAWLQRVVFSAVSMWWTVETLTGFRFMTLGGAVAWWWLMAGTVALTTAVAFSAAVLLADRLRVALWITLPVSWVACEWTLARLGGGLGWNALGYCAYRELRLIQFAEFTGVYGVSALIVLANVTAFSYLSTLTSERRSMIALVVLLGTALAFGTFRLRQIDGNAPAGSLRIGLVSGTTPQVSKWDPRQLPASLRFFEERTERIAGTSADLIVWPETAAPFYFLRDERYPADLVSHLLFRRRLLELARRTRTSLLFGSLALEQEQGVLHAFNRAYLVSADGVVEDFYDKINLAPWGEYTPLEKMFLRGRTWHVNDLTAGTRQTVFTVGDAKLGVMLCYESLLPEVARGLAANGARILVNPTNDAWFLSGVAPAQLLATVVFRAIETRAPVVRVANEGISAVVKPSGRFSVEGDPSLPPGVSHSVEWLQGRSAYVRVGDAFAAACLLLVSLGFAIAVLWRPAHPRTRTALGEIVE